MTASPGWERTHRTGRRQPEERGACVLRPAAKVIARTQSEDSDPLCGSQPFAHTTVMPQDARAEDESSRA